MKSSIVLAILFFSSICFAQELKISAVTSYKTCRKDFAVKLCKLNPDTYNCFRFSKDKQKYVTWDEMFTDSRIRTMVQKINRRNTIVWKNHCIAIPNDLGKSELDYAPFQRELFVAPPGSGGHRKSIVVDLRLLAWGAYEGPHLVAWGPANGGMGKCKETGKNECKTPLGVWKIIKKGPAVMKSKLYPVDCEDKSVCGHPMYWFMQFHPRGEGLHGDKNLPGSNVSHGCVRLLKSDAKWLNQNFVDIGTEIIIEVY